MRLYQSVNLNYLPIKYLYRNDLKICPNKPYIWNKTVKIAQMPIKLEQTKIIEPHSKERLEWRFKTIRHRTAYRFLVLFLYNRYGECTLRFYRLRTPFVYFEILQRKIALSSDLLKFYRVTKMEYTEYLLWLLQTILFKMMRAILYIQRYNRIRTWYSNLNVEIYLKILSHM